MTKFPKVLAAARQIEIDQRLFGEALVDECGDPIRETLLDASEFLLQHGLTYTENYLYRLRQVAYNFRGAKIPSKISWSVLEEAGDPDTLKAIISGKPKGRDITRDYVRGIREEAEARASKEDRDDRELPKKAEIVARDVPELANTYEIKTMINKAEVLIVKAMTEVSRSKSKLSDDGIAAIHEAFVAVAEKAREGSQLAGKPIFGTIKGGRVA